MRELAAQSVLLVRSFEEADRDASLLRPEERRAATAAGRAASHEPEQQAEGRAAALLEPLERELPALRRVRALTRLSPGLVVPVGLLAMALGLSSSALGPARRVNLLALPLLTLLAWNVLVYVVLIAERLVGSAVGHRQVGVRDGGVGKDQDTSGWSAARWAPVVGAIAWTLWEGVRGRVRAGDPRRTEIAARALAAYGQAWGRATAPLFVARARLLLHVGAALLALGAVLGMYARGLALEYRMTWESTFLDAESVAAVLHVVLGPAAAVLGERLPDPAALTAMATPEGAAPAARWIHLWALTALVVVIVPRLALATAALYRASQLALRVPVDPLSGSFRELLAPERGAGKLVAVYPYSHRPGTREQSVLRELLQDLFGLKARIEAYAAAAYGADPIIASSPACLVVVFTLVQSPEREVHGRYVELLAAQGHGSGSLLVVVDSSTWRERFADHEEQRRAERTRAWDRVLRDVGCGTLHVDLGRPLGEEILLRAEASLWPAPTPTRRSGRGA